MKILETFKCQIPNWALSALVNGDYSGLSEEDAAKIDAWLDSWDAPVDIVPTKETSGFTRYPEFGDSCDTTTCELLAR